MSKISYLICTLFITLLLSGCYHAQVTTGEEPSLEVYDQTFASGWLFGLIPPDVVRAENECSSGVARVETRLSFVNMLVGNLTFGIYTPMHIRVTCAASRAELPGDESNTIKVVEASSYESIQQAFKDAAERAIESRQPAFVEIR